MPKPKCNYLIIKTVDTKVEGELLIQLETLDKPKPCVLNGKAQMSVRLGKKLQFFRREALCTETFLSLNLTKVVRKTTRSARHRSIIDSSHERASHFRFSSNAKRNW